MGRFSSALHELTSECLYCSKSLIALTLASVSIRLPPDGAKLFLCVEAYAPVDTRWPTQPPERRVSRDFLFIKHVEHPCFGGKRTLMASCRAVTLQGDEG